MVRRRKKESILDLVIAGNWKFSATLALLICFITFIVMPSITNPILKPITLGVRPLGLFLIAVFTIIAIVKFLRQKSTNKNKYFDYLNTPTAAFPKTLPEINEISQLERPTAWSLKVIQDIEWKRFEELSVAYYQAKGICAEATSLGADGGIDIKLYQDKSSIPTAIVQCKAWSGKQVGVKEVREFLGVMTHEKIAKGFYMTSGEYTNEAKVTAAANKIVLITGEMLLAMIKRLPDESQQILLRLAIQGDYKTPTCSSCGVKMVKRSGKRGEFWGCINYPRCKQMFHVKSQNKYSSKN